MLAGARPVSTSLSATRRVATVVLDASVLINLLILNRVGILAELPGYRFVLLDSVEQEIRRPRHQTLLTTAFEHGFVDRAASASPEELKIFAQYIASMGLGEAACLAAAEHRGWLLASDERGLCRSIAATRLGASRILTTSDILTIALQSGVIRIADIRDAMSKLEWDPRLDALQHTARAVAQ